MTILAKSMKAFAGPRSINHIRISSQQFTSSARRCTAADRGQGRDFKDQRPMIDRMSLKGRTTIITGGARGIGLSLVRAVAEAGSNIAVFDVLDKPQYDLSKLGVKAEYYHVTAAGIVADKPFFDHKWEECERLLKVNVLACMERPKALFV
ncbi:short chain dehydrogenase [Stemphylium lycopersici]|uniref:Short chain dehydrogenase n=1 Tax=Stemphylium lycopersici TaxID=183478 RepID=A0A364N2M5_STELY|nr:short chain dehydrogenase [Stemphylium lycopersici]